MNDTLMNIINTLPLANHLNSFKLNITHTYMVADLCHVVWAYFQDEDLCENMKLLSSRGGTKIVTFSRFRVATFCPATRKKPATL